MRRFLGMYWRSNPLKFSLLPRCLKLNDDLEVFARLGTARMKGKVTASNGNASLSSDASTTHTLYGIGAAYTLNKEWKAVIDYTKLTEKDDMKATMVSVGARYSGIPPNL